MPQSDGNIVLVHEMEWAIQKVHLRFEQSSN